jgi:hypothetical protein
VREKPRCRTHGVDSTMDISGYDLSKSMSDCAHINVLPPLARIG